jgi:hypothetical protein
MINLKIGQQVRDYASNRIATIVAIDAGQFAILDYSVPLDPTNDGAFPSRHRNYFELGPADQPVPADWTY